MCGEKEIYDKIMNRGEGSPPRVRGKDVDDLAAEHEARITPACAGKSHVWPETSPCRWDHPRVCGEKRREPHLEVDIVGSPPRVRGKAR